MKRQMASLLLVGLLGWACVGCRAAEPPLEKPVADVLSAPPGDLFRAYQFDFSSADPQLNFDGLPQPAKKSSVTRDATGALVKVEEPGIWRGYWGVGSLGQWEGYQPIFGGERLHLTYSVSADANAHVVFSVQYLGGETFEINAPGDIQADGKMHELGYTLPESANGKKITAVWMRIENGATGTTQVRVGQFAWDRRRIDNRLDADRILATPPLHDTRVAPINGVMTFTIDGKPVTGLGWASILNVTTGDEEMKQVVGDTDFKLSRLVFALGESVHTHLYPPSWLGPNQYDFSYLDGQMARLLKANPNTKILLYVALDGAKWWTWMHPEAAAIAPMQAIGVPDYLSPEWRRDSREAIRQMVAHVQSSSYAGAVVGYELFNGQTMDTTYWVEKFTPRATARYRAFLRERYKTDKALQDAWRDPKASFATARIPLDEKSGAEMVAASEWTAPQVTSRFPLLREPALNRKLDDEIKFSYTQYHQVTLNFARDLKEATQRRAVVGSRTGDFMGNAWWAWPDPLTLLRSNVSDLLLSPDFDFFEVQESYFGRGIADYGSGVPILPPKGLMAHNKLIVIENDVRTFLTNDPKEGFGRTPDLPTTIQMQRRVFVNSLVLGMSEYLWQMSYHFNDPAMIADYRKMEGIGEKAVHTDRSSGAQVAFVYDKNYLNFFSYDPLKTGPSRGVSLFDWPKFSWARAGVPFDQIFLDQLPQAKKYKVYIFVHTVGLTDAQRAMIKSVVRRDGRVAIFLWADGLIDGQRIDTAKMSDLTGMKIALSEKPANWKISATPWFQKQARVLATEPLGTLPINEEFAPNAPDIVYSPSFSVDDAATQALGVYDAGNPLAGKTGIALRKTPQWSSIYSASPNLRPQMLRYAAQLAGVFSYTDSDDASYINNSFIGFNARQTHDIHVKLPHPSALYEVFRDQELPLASAFSLPVTRGETYLFFRGSKAQWEALGKTESGAAKISVKIP